MSGFVAAYGTPDIERLHSMLELVRHRGPHIQGTWSEGAAAMAQNYLRADLFGPSPETVPISGCGHFHICYDGQIGDRSRLCMEAGLDPGSTSEETLLLELYRREGPGMLQHLGDAVFAFVISDGRKLFAARDLLGIKTLFYGRRQGSLYLGCELKSLLPATQDLFEFPPGHFMDSTGKPHRFSQLPVHSPRTVADSPEDASATVRKLVGESFDNRLDLARPTAALLSGGLDSSVICTEAVRAVEERFGPKARLTTYAIGVGESGDVVNARTVARHLGTEHHELLVSPEEVMEALPRVIYYLESYDPSLVRSAAANFLISRHVAGHGFEVLLSGEGGDEVFCGYDYLAGVPLEELFRKQMECLGFLHNNAALRLDRMNLAHSMRVVAPLISGRLLDYAMQLPPHFKQKPRGEGRMEKWILRKAYETSLPAKIVWRSKQEFSEGSGSAEFLIGNFEHTISDGELAEAQREFPHIRSKEELYYFNIFAKHFGTGRAVQTVGQWICL
jgi:asparagine synthase (glutamine-hydrolysing)